MKFKVALIYFNKKGRRKIKKKKKIHTCHKDTQGTNIIMLIQNIKFMKFKLILKKNNNKN